jgi:uncharacterized membrane protein YqjE
MEYFLIRPTTWPVLRLFSRNPLMRTTDRVEAAVAALAVLLVVIAAACAGVIGTMIHDIESQNFREQARTRHVLVAKAVDDSKSAAPGETKASVVQARWNVNGVDHTGVVVTQYAIKGVGALQIWVDGDGNRVDPPTPIARAAMDALSVAVVGWSVVAMAGAEVVAAVRTHLTRVRNNQWEIEIRSLVEDDGGRTNHSP